MRGASRGPGPADAAGRARGWRRVSGFALLIGVLYGGAPIDTGAQSLFRESTQQEAVLPDPMPKVPSSQETIKFYVSPTTTNQFAVDPASFGIDGETVVRFTLVVTSATGVRNVTYEALRCDSAEQILLAVARVDGTWSVVKNAKWQRLDRDAASNRQRPELYSRLCEGSAVAARTPQRLAIRMRSIPFIAP